MHGYDAAECPNMRGTAILWHYKHPMSSKNLGTVDNTQWHATVAKILGISPAPDTDPRAVRVP
jgi:hypothetical protein